MGRKLLFLLLICLLFALHSTMCFADNTVYLNCNFTEDNPYVIFAEKQATFETVYKNDENADSYLLINKSTLSDCYLEYNTNDLLSDNLVIEFKLYSKKTGFDGNLLMLRDKTSSANTDFYPLGISSDKSTLRSNNTDILDLTPSDTQEWHTIAVCYDFTTHKYDVYCDDLTAPVTSGINNAKKIKSVSVVRLYFGGKNTSGELGIDDFRIYSGDSPCDIGNTKEVIKTPFFSDRYSDLVLSGKKAVEISANTLFDGSKKISCTYPVLNYNGEVYISAEDSLLLFGNESMAGENFVFNGIGYVNLKNMAESGGYKIYTNSKGFYLFYEDTADIDENNLLEAAKYMFFERYNSDELKSMVITDLKHPYLFGGTKKIGELKSVLNSEEGSGVKEIVRERYDKIIAEADKYIDASDIDYTITDGLRMLGAAKEFKERAVTLAFAYKMTDADKYIQHLKLEIDRAVALDSWNGEKHFLDPSELALGMIFAYDWCYDELGIERLNLIEGALNRNFLSYIEATYKCEISAFWTTANINWNMVVNASAAVCALGLWNTDSDRYSWIAELAQKAAENSFYMFAGSGAWFEGLHYWEYTMEYACYMLSAFESVFGNDLNYSRLCGFDNTAYFSLMLDSPQGMNDFHDGYSLHTISSAYFYMGNKFDDYHITSAKLFLDDKYGLDAGVFDLLWYDLSTVKKSINISPDSYFPGVEAASLRQSWKLDDGAFISFHGGDNSSEHSHIDAGAFVYDNLGERWAMDIGIENYSSAESESKYFRTSLEAHNTVEFQNGGGQNTGATAKIIGYDSGINSGYAIMDLSDVYSEDVISFERGIRLINNRKVGEIYDEFMVNGTKTLVWRMNTEADVELMTDGKGAVLSKNGKQLHLLFETDAENYKIFVDDELPLNSYRNDGIKQVVITLEINDSAYISVLLGKEEDMNNVQIAPLEQWKVNEPDIRLYSGTERIYYPEEGEITVESAEHIGSVVCAEYDDNRLINIHILKNGDKCNFNGGLAKIFWFNNLNDIKPLGNALEWK